MRGGATRQGGEERDRPARNANGNHGGAAVGARLLRRDSRRVRSHVHERVRSGLLPWSRRAGLTASALELAAESWILLLSRGQRCDQPLKTWLLVLMALQAISMVLRLLGSFFGHVDHYEVYRTDSGEWEVARSDSIGSAGNGGGGTTAAEESGPASEHHGGNIDALMADVQVPAHAVQQYTRVLNAVYLGWVVMGSMWISESSTCAATAPYLFRLCVILVLIYFAFLMLPLLLVTLIICCLPLFIRFLVRYAERARRLERAADQDTVNRLPVIRYDEGLLRGLDVDDDEHDRDDDVPICTICLSEYERADEIRKLPCGHHFHRQCVDQWLLSFDKSCPQCRTDVDATADGGGERGSRGTAWRHEEQEMV
ncbi:hypothetical protein CDCA_CDCA12G3457 [Cyanidium caldarium]|uniref:RING-type domain-containing protein n=1 Tax=Cyanidium caldarium TaxID=2771 RepID=A0AAV9IYR8_CYACA|nr:hypothetical protein CDCA_CDCA12G3457 [Cyanidium caldarium]